MTIRAFNTGFDTVSLHRPTVGPRTVQVHNAAAAGRAAGGVHAPHERRRANINLRRSRGERTAGGVPPGGGSFDRDEPLSGSKL